MKTTLPICCSMLVITGVARGQDSMSLEQFNALVATPGDTNALRAELASLPFWKVAKCSSVFKLPDGRVVKEESVATTKTIGGKYVVCSMDSQYINEPMRAVITYDEKASAIKSWGITGGSLVVSTVVLDPEKRITASSGTHGEFVQISVGTFSDTEAFSRVSVYKDGVLCLTREVTSWPMKAELDGAATGSQPIRPETNQTSSAAGSRHAP
jgi:hypothetical protein